MAARALRLAHLLRTAPDVPATTEFTKYEFEACYILSKQRRDRRKTVLLGELLSMIAELGSFANNESVFKAAFVEKRDKAEKAEKKTAA